MDSLLNDLETDAPQQKKRKGPKGEGGGAVGLAIKLVIIVVALGGAAWMIGGEALKGDKKSVAIEAMKNAVEQESDDELLRRRATLVLQIRQSEAAGIDDRLAKSSLERVEQLLDGRGVDYASQIVTDATIIDNN